MNLIRFFKTILAIGISMTLMVACVLEGGGDGGGGKRVSKSKGILVEFTRVHEIKSIHEESDKSGKIAAKEVRYSCRDNSDDGYYGNEYEEDIDTITYNLEGNSLFIGDEWSHEDCTTERFRGNNSSLFGTWKIQSMEDYISLNNNAENNENCPEEVLEERRTAMESVDLIDNYYKISKETITFKVRYRMCMSEMAREKYEYRVSPEEDYSPDAPPDYPSRSSNYSRPQISTEKIDCLNIKLKVNGKTAHLEYRDIRYHGDTPLGWFEKITYQGKTCESFDTEGPPPNSAEACAAVNALQKELEQSQKLKRFDDCLEELGLVE